MLFWILFQVFYFLTIFLKNNIAEPTLLLASVNAGFPYFVLSKSQVSKGKNHFLNLFITFFSDNYIEAYTASIQNNIKPEKIKKWLDNCSKAQGAWKKKKDDRLTAEGVEKGKKGTEEPEVPPTKEVEESPNKKILKKKLVDDNPSF